MSAKKFLKDFLIIFCIAFVVSILVTFLYELIFHGTGLIDWSVSLRQGIIFGIILALADNRKTSK
jgi:hypothetical protein